MSFIRYKQRDQKWYVYQVDNLWNKETKKYIQKSKYLGVAEEKGSSYKKREIQLVEKGIIDFGDSYIISKIFEQSGLKSILEQSIGNVDTIINLVIYQLTVGSAMYNCKEWHEGNIARYLFPKAQYTSQKISQFFQQCGDEKLLRQFFQLYVKKFFQGSHGILIDSTSLPSAINTNINTWGHTATNIETKVGCLMLLDTKTELPIFFRIIPGDIADVSTLRLTIDEINKLGLNIQSAIFDAGYFSEENIKFLCANNINFVSRMPKSRTIFQELIDSIGSIEKPSNAVQYGKRIIFIETKVVTLYDNEVYAHIILDMDKKSKDTHKLLNEYLANSNNIDDWCTVQIMSKTPTIEQMKKKSFIAVIGSDKKVILYDRQNFNNPITAKLLNDNGFYEELQKIRLQKDLRILVNHYAEYLISTGRYNRDDNLSIQYCGFIILISKAAIAKQDILPTYYIRQSIEQIFGFAKINNLLPLRVHSEIAIKGYVFTIFIALIIFITLRKYLNNYLTVEQALLILRNWKCKIYENQAVPTEPNKKIKEIFKKIKLTVPISVGI